MVFSAIIVSEVEPTNFISTIYQDISYEFPMTGMTSDTISPKKKYPKNKFPKGAYMICFSKLGERFSQSAIRGINTVNTWKVDFKKFVLQKVRTDNFVLNILIYHGRHDKQNAVSSNLETHFFEEAFLISYDFDNYAINFSFLAVLSLYFKRILAEDLNTESELENWASVAFHMFLVLVYMVRFIW